MWSIIATKFVFLEIVNIIFVWFYYSKVLPKIIDLIKELEKRYSDRTKNPFRSVKLYTFAPLPFSIIIALVFSLFNIF